MTGFVTRSGDLPLMPGLRWEPHGDVVRTPNHGSPREPKIGCMIHYDGSSSDAGAVSWFQHRDCEVSYNYLALDDGSFVQLVVPDRRAWHAGWCRTSDPDRLPYRDANSALVGIAAATDDQHDVTPLQTLTVAWLCRLMFVKYGWDPSETWRIVGHDTEAVYPPGHPREGERGRKTDPTGSDPNNPILSVEDVRSLVPLVEL